MDKKKSDDIYQEINAVSLLDYLEKYRHNWTKHVHRMHRKRVPRQIKHYRSNGKGSLERPNKKLNETATGL